MKKYVYQKKFYNVRVAYAGYFAALFLIWSIYRYIVEKDVLWAFAILACVYVVFNTFISHSYPEEVDIDDHRITFRSFGTVHSYDFKQIEDFRIKENPASKRIYLRINRNISQLVKGRYWIECSYFNDGLELFNYLLAKEDEIHPDTVKAYAHKSNEFSPEEKKKIEERQQERKDKSVFNRKKKK
ncbi:MAG: hypothetical protein IJM79_02795 [Erysipelotrichaceae bacterium]|nr:hypothetical protein [Erysipelotrichaceae bacterium]